MHGNQQEFAVSAPLVMAGHIQPSHCFSMHPWQCVGNHCQNCQSVPSYPYHNTQAWQGAPLFEFFKAPPDQVQEMYRCLPGASGFPSQQNLYVSSDNEDGASVLKNRSRRNGSRFLNKNRSNFESKVSKSLEESFEFASGCKSSELQTQISSVSGVDIAEGTVPFHSNNSFVEECAVLYDSFVCRAK